MLPGTYSIMAAFPGDTSFLASSGSSVLTVTSGNAHPADHPGKDGKISIAEVTAYGVAWKNGTSWPAGPATIPIAYVTNAGFIWKSGEVYHYDSSLTPPWAPGASRAAKTRAASLSTNSTSSAVSTVSVVRTAAGNQYKVTLQVKLAPGSSVYAVEETIPTGWSVKAVTDGAKIDPRAGKVRWLYFEGAPRSLSYTLAPPRNAWWQTKLTGVVSTNGKNAAITGVRSIGSR
jgi:hypothetical protein